MGVEMASTIRPSDAGLRGIMVANLSEWADLSEDEAGLIAAAWLAPEKADWDKYFHLTGLMALRLHPDPALLAEEDYTLMHRAQTGSHDRAEGMLAAMQKTAPERYRNLPAFRTMVSRLHARFK